VDVTGEPVAGALDGVEGTAGELHGTSFVAVAVAVVDVVVGR
jgi:hypothetical protein